jgi:hypothetical protein
MAGRLIVERPVFSGDFKQCIDEFLQPLRFVDLPALETRAWLLLLSDSGKLFIFEEFIGPDNFACDCCRIVGEFRAAMAAPGARVVDIA